MSTPSGQPSQTLRIAGGGLVVVALVLAGVGIFADNGDSGDGASAQGSTTLPGVTTTDGAAPSATTDPAAPADGAPSDPAAPSEGAASPSSVPRSTVSPAPQSPGSPGAPVPAPGAGTAGGGAAGGGTAGGPAGGGTGAGGTGAASSSGGVDFAIPVRIYNNSTITGLASDAARELEAAGWDEVSTGNYAAGVIPTTTVYYRPGTAERTAADRIASTIGARSEERFVGLDDATPGVIVIVTNDYNS